MRRPFVFALLASVLRAPATAWGDGLPPTPAITPAPGSGTDVTRRPPDPVVLWLDEVQAQRAVVEARRQSTKEAARLRAVDPCSPAGSHGEEVRMAP